jgi:hypothetical protein
MEQRVFLNTEGTEYTKEEGSRKNWDVAEENDVLVMGHSFLIGGRKLAELRDGGGDNV